MNTSVSHLVALISDPAVEQSGVQVSYDRFIFKASCSLRKVVEVQGTPSV